MKIDEEKDVLGEKLKMLDKKVEEIINRSKELDEKEELLFIRETTIYDKEEFLEDKVEETYEEREDLNKSRTKIKKQEKLVQLITDKLECPVYLKVPHSGAVLGCPILLKFL